jgi:DNA-binding PadR family transcriptional regulator
VSNGVKNPFLVMFQFLDYHYSRFWNIKADQERFMSPKELRVTPSILYVLLSLAEEPRHGYAILNEVESRSKGQIQLGPSTLYYTLGRLADAGLIEEDGGPEEPSGTDPHESQRRYFTITEIGRDRLREELGALMDLVDHARALGLSMEG